MKDVSEQQIQKAISDYLKLKKFIVFKHRNVGIFKKDTGSYIPLSAGEKGISDIVGCSPRGRFVAIEVKKPGGRPSPDQLDFIARIKASGGIAFIAYSFDEVLSSHEIHAESITAYGHNEVWTHAPQVA